VATVAIIQDDQGNQYALMECPHCDSYEMHAPLPGREGVFHCALCFATFNHSE
jgi:hypothetical protein